MSAFSKRHRRALADETLVVELGERVRTRIWRLLSRYNGTHWVQPDPNDQWTQETDYISEVGGELLDIWGEAVLPGASETPSDVEGFVLNGPASGVLDTIELFIPYISESERAAFLATLNELLAEEDTTWRVLDREMVQLDSVFVHEQIVARAKEVIAQHGFEGAADELRRAQNDLLDGDPRGAVHNAGSSFESVAKAVLGVTHGTARQLILQLKEKGYFDGLPEEHIDGFATNVLESVPWMRNRLGGHGQGKDAVELPAPYARLALNLAAALDQSIIELKLSRDGEPTTPEDHLSAGDFSSAFVAGDDDIPF
jgi:AcrR family transcriptional regulator